MNLSSFQRSTAERPLEHFGFGKLELKDRFFEIAPRLQEKCGLSAVIIDPAQASALGVDGNHAFSATFTFCINQQNRGAASAGYSVQAAGSREIVGNTWPGKVHELPVYYFPVGTNYSAVMHNRWPTTGAEEDPYSAQPFITKAVISGDETSFSVSHNGNLTNKKELSDLLESYGVQWKGESDSCLIPHLCELLSRQFEFKDPAEMVHKLTGMLKGSYNLVFHFPDCIVTATDPHKNRPLFFATDKRADCGSYYIFSETSAALEIQIPAFDTGNLICAPIPRGSIVSFRPGQPPVFYDKLQSMPNPSSECLFELAYIRNPDGAVGAQVKADVIPVDFHGLQMYPLKDFASIFEFRTELGRQLSKENSHWLLNANYIAHIPDSGYPFAQGISEQAQVPMLNLFIRRERTDAIFRTRSYMQGGAKRQATAAGEKYIIDEELIASLGPEALRGAKLVFADDSVVSGTTLKVLAPYFKILREKYGVAEIDFFVGFPKVKYDCPYGTKIDPTRLWAVQLGHLTEEELLKRYGLNRVIFSSVEGYKAVAEQFGVQGCDECASGNTRISDWDRENRSLPIAGDVFLGNGLS